MSTVAERPARAEPRRRPRPPSPSATGNAPFTCRSEAPVTASTRSPRPPATSWCGPCASRPRPTPPSTRSPSPRAAQPACTCPDFTINGAVCKHVGALKALGLIPGRKARPAAARRSHARRLAEPAEAPAPASAPQPAGAFATGFRSAVAAELRRMSGQVEPEPEPEGCLYCGDPFDPAISRDPHFCAPARRKGVPGEHSPRLSVAACRSGRHDPARSHPARGVPLFGGIRRLRAVDHPRPRGGRRPLADLTVATPDGWVVLEPCDLAGAARRCPRRAGPVGRGESRPGPRLRRRPGGGRPGRRHRRPADHAGRAGRPRGAGLPRLGHARGRFPGPPDGAAVPARPLDRRHHAGGPRGPHGGLGSRPPPAVGGPRPRRRPPAGSAGGPRPGLRGDPARAAPLRRPLARGPERGEGRGVRGEEEGGPVGSSSPLVPRPSPKGRSRRRHRGRRRGRPASCRPGGHGGPSDRPDRGILPPSRGHPARGRRHDP